MRIRAILRFKNENFRAARIAAGFLTMRSLSEKTGIHVSQLHGYESFRSYPTMGNERKWGHNKPSRHIELLERELKMPIDDLFPPIYKQAVDQGRGRPIERIAEIKELPEWCGGPSNYLPSPEDEYETTSLGEKIKEALLSLTDREAIIIKERFGLFDDDEHTLEEMAEKYKVSRERIRQIETKALRKLDSFDKGEKLRSFLNQS